MAGEKKVNSNLDVQGSIKATTVPNSTGTLVTFNSSTKVFGTRTNEQIISDLNLSSNFVPYTGATANVDLGTRSITSTGGFIGNASTANTLATARTINGTSFNGSANITTANWGTARNITIGNTTKSVNGSGNVAWSLAEIGAASQSSLGNYLPLNGSSSMLGTLTSIVTGRSLHSSSTGSYIQVGSDGGGSAGILGSGMSRGSIGNNYRTYWAYDSYWDEASLSWKASRNTLGNKLQIEQGYHSGGWKFRAYIGDVSTSWLDESWTDILTIGTTGNATLVGNLTVTGGNSTQWNAAYSWGNHALAGYLTSSTAKYISIGNGSQTGVGNGNGETLRNGSVWSTPTTGGIPSSNGSVVSFNPYSDGSYGFQLGARANKFYGRTLENGTLRSWVQFWHEDNFNPSNYALATHTHTFDSLTSKPTTIAGYGITDAPTKTGTGASGTWGISITGNAATATNATTATSLQTARTLTIGNTGKTFDGTNDVSWSLAEIGAQSILTNPVTGTGTTNFLTKFTASGTIGDSQIFDNGTSVGIGTTTPTFTLDVQAISSNIRVSSSVGTNRAYTQFANTGGTFNVGLDNSTGAGLGTNAPYAGTIMHYGNYPIVIGTNATERVRISGNGNVGIGTANPVSKLDVQNNTGQDSGVLSAELLISSGWTSTGWTGDFLNGFSHTTGNTSVLSNTLVAIVNNFYRIIVTVTNRTAGSFVFSFGGVTTGGVSSTYTFSLKAITTSNFTLTPTSDFNGTVAIAIQRVDEYAAAVSIKNSNGTVANEIRASFNSSNVIMGISAGRRHLNIANTFVGNGAGRDAVTGGYNTAIGNGALSSNVNNSYITSIGWNVLNTYNNPLGTNAYLTALGGSIGNSSFVGSVNTFIGWNNALELTTGGNNIGIGYMAFRASGNSSANVIVGDSVNRAVGTYSNNTLIGNEALYSITSGDNNVAVGRRAARYIADGTTANTNSSNSIFIGTNTRPLAASQSNQIVIGDSAIGLGSNTVVLGNDLITKTILKGNVGIGTTTPEARLVSLDTSNNISALFGGGVTNPNWVAIGTVGSGASPFIQAYNNTRTSTSNLSLNPIGANVSIGHTSPTQKLDVTGNIKISNNNSLMWRNAANNADIAILQLTNTNQLNIGTNSSSVPSVIALHTNSTERIRIDSSGNVGIGTTSPGAKLDVRAQGALATDIAFRVRNSTDTANFLTVTGRGDVYNSGISNNVLNTFFGYGAGRSITVGLNNSFFGTEAGSSNTTGGGNVFVGEGAGFSNTAGGGNTAVGRNALGFNTTGTTNTAFGAFAGVNINGNNNNIFGFNAARFLADGTTILTSCNESIFIGNLTKANDNSQSNQIVIGYNAIGLGSNSVVLGNDSIVTTALKGNVGIGTSDPFAKLHISGSFIANSPEANFLVDSTNMIKASVASTTHGTGAGFYLIDDSAAFGFNPFGEFKRSVRANYTEGVWFENESNCKLGLHPVKNNLWSEGNIIQAETPSNKSEPVAWIKIFNKDNEKFYFMPVYQ